MFIKGSLTRSRHVSSLHTQTPSLPFPVGIGLDFNYLLMLGICTLQKDGSNQDDLTHNEPCSGLIALCRTLPCSVPVPQQ